MNLWFWILWVFAGIVLLAELPHPWYYIGYGMLVFAFVCLILTVRRILTSGTKLECTMYLALYYNEKMSDVLLATGYDIPDRVVHAVLRSWKSKGWINQCPPPKDVRDESDEKWYTITLAGQTELPKRYHNT